MSAPTVIIMVNANLQTDEYLAVTRLLDWQLHDFSCCSARVFVDDCSIHFPGKVSHDEGGLCARRFTNDEVAFVTPKITAAIYQQRRSWLYDNSFPRFSFSWSRFAGVG